VQLGHLMTVLSGKNIQLFRQSGLEHGSGGLGGSGVFCSRGWLGSSRYRSWLSHVIGWADILGLRFCVGVHRCGLR